MKMLIVPFYGYLNGKVKKLWNIKKVAKMRNFQLSNHDEVGTHVLAIDKFNRSLLVAKNSIKTNSCLIVDLNKLEACSVKKEYGCINAGEVKTKKLTHFLERIFLNLVFKNDKKVFSLQLFDAEKEQVSNIEHLEWQVRRWENTVSKLLPARVKALPWPATLFNQ